MNTTPGAPEDRWSDDGTPGTTGRALVPGVPPRKTFLALAPLPSAISRARLHARNILTEWQLTGLIDEAELLVSELMTNALDASVIMPAKPPIALRLVSDGTRLIIEAWDHSPLDLQHLEFGDDAECGRGLTVIAALSQAWGVQRISCTHKVVWCELQFDYRLDQ